MLFHVLIYQQPSVCLLIIFIFAFTPALILSATTPSQYNFTIAKPNCDDRCGNISIPLPFGTKPECYQSRHFWVTCNYTFYPPKLFWQDTSIEFTDISLDGQLKLLQFLARDCYANDGTRISRNSPWITLAKYFTVNNTANKFTIVGCDTFAFIYGRRLGRRATTACAALCETKEDLMEAESCMGVGCCQTSIPKYVWMVEFDLGSYWNYSRVRDFNNCSYAFVAEESAFNFSSESLNDLEKVERLPMVVDWAIGNGTCEEAKMNATSYACASPHSHCYKPDNGDGYRCRCDQGYEGNPYLRDGCQDIDECADRNLNDCMRISLCKNTAGSYSCSCPPGYSSSGDGRGPDGCKDIDECANISLHNCWRTEYCTNTESSFSCFCPKGYTGNGRGPDGCKDINECASASLNDCTEIAQCKNAEGNYTCSCPEGYSGSGRGRHGCMKQDLASKKQDMKIAYVLIGVAFGITTLLLVAILLHLELKRRRVKRMKQKFFLQNGGMLLQEKLNRRERSPEMVRIYSSFELQKATNDFDNSMIIGQGGFGTVYKGLLLDKVVAIKKSKRVDPTQIDQFINEVLVLSQVNHRNVVRLLGCCLETEVPLLVYDFISNGTLSSHIHNQTKSCFFNWDMRLKIAAETAGVLSYLHSAASTPIIHRDVKSDNILLDHTFTAKVSDFGASKLVPLDLTQLSTMVQGTFGYLDPEYMQTNQLTEKSDVYSFGVVLLELLTGRKAISFDKPEEEKNLANFFFYIVKQDRLHEILDENIVSNGNMEQISEVARLAKGCLNVKGEDRPSMIEVAMELEGLKLGGKHSWAINEYNTEEMESLLGKGVGVIGFGNGEGTSTSAGYDSVGYRSLTLSGGR